MGFTLDLSLEKEVIELFFAASNQYSLVINVLPVAELDVRLVFILIHHLMTKVGGGR